MTERPFGTHPAVHLFQIHTDISTRDEWAAHLDRHAEDGGNLTAGGTVVCNGGPFFAGITCPDFAHGTHVVGRLQPQLYRDSCSKLFFAGAARTR